MIIKKLLLKNFRNIDSINLDFHEKLNYFVGDNAQGKTNIIESIHYCSFLKSFRNKNNLDLIQNGFDSFFLELIVKNKLTEDNLKIYFNKRKERKIQLNHKRPNGNEFFDKLCSIIYYPDEINYLILYPQYRRNYIDRSLFLLDKNYINIIYKYKKILKNRNNLLKDQRYDKELDFVWLDSLINESIKIIVKRNNYIDSINKVLKKENTHNESYEINYKIYNFENLYDFLYEKITKNLDRDLKFGYTSFGPHSDDFIFKINTEDIRRYSSEGQKKSFILKLKKAQMCHYYNLNKDYPVLIIDDIANELDKRRKHDYLSDLIENSGQVFITTTEFDNDYDTDYSLFRVANGKVIY